MWEIVEVGVFMRYNMEKDYYCTKLNLNLFFLSNIDSEVCFRIY